MRLWQLQAFIILLFGIVFAGAFVIAPSKAKDWTACSNPTDDLSRSLCAEFR